MPQSFAEQVRAVPMTPSLGETLDRALSFARAQAHRAVLLEHLLLALTEDPEAAAVLRTCNIDLDRLGTDASVYLGRLLEDMRADNGAQPGADGELLKVLQAAGQAALQSKRRQIDGAIVLAAIVGDGKSPAAGLLKAHGLTFEEAIRALQKAKAQARSKQFATPPVNAAQAEEPGPVGADKPAHTGGGDDAGAAQPQGSGQTVDDILAAARNRIQARSAASAGKPGGKPPVAAPSGGQPETPPLSSLTASPPAAPPPEPDATPAEPAAATPPAALAAASLPVAAPRPSWPPVPMPRLPQSSPQPAPPPVPGGANPPRPPQRQGAAANAPLPGLPASRPARAPWPDPAEPTSPPRPVGANGAIAAPHPALPAGRSRPIRQGQRTGAPGPLVEAIPRRMRVGMPSTAQVRISRDKIDGLILLLLNGRGVAHRPDAFLARALSVRLRAPDGGFWIEPESPETQWVTPGPQQQDDYMSWDWTVTPQWRGKARLLLLLTARTVGRDGIAAETAPPDRVIEVTVRGRPLRRLGRLVGLAATVAIGAALGRFGHEIWTLAAAIVKRIGGG